MDSSENRMILDECSGLEYMEHTTTESFTILNLRDGLGKWEINLPVRNENINYIWVIIHDCINRMNMV